MKLFLKRDEQNFLILDQSGNLKYNAIVTTENTKQRIVAENADGIPQSVILHKNSLIRHFSVRCCGKMYILVPVTGECFAFAIYGSTYRFTGDTANGRFSLYDVDKSPVMTQKKCWSKFGDGYELKIYSEKEELFAVSVAICAAVFLSSAEENAILI